MDADAFVEGRGAVLNFTITEQLKTIPRVAKSLTIPNAAIPAANQARSIILAQHQLFEMAVVNVVTINAGGVEPADRPVANHQVRIEVNGYHNAITERRIAQQGKAAQIQGHIIGAESDDIGFSKNAG